MRETLDLSLAGPLRSPSWSSWSRRSLALAQALSAEKKAVESLCFFQKGEGKLGTRMDQNEDQTCHLACKRIQSLLQVESVVESIYVHFDCLEAMMGMLECWNVFKPFRLVVFLPIPQMWLIGCRLVRIFIWVRIKYRIYQTVVKGFLSRMSFGCKSAMFKTNLATWLKNGVPKNPHHLISMKTNPCEVWVYIFEDL